MSEHVTVTTEDDRVTVTLDRPESLNALPTDDVRSLAETFDGIDTDDGNAVVVRGAGAHFSVGADLDDLDSVDEATARGLSETYADLVAEIRTCPLPVIAAVRGRALGFGFLVAMAADFVIAASDAKFATPEVQLGIPISGFAVTILPRLVGERRARDWLLTGRDIPAAEALDAGFVNRTVESNSLNDAVLAVVDDLRDGSVYAIAELKHRLSDPIPQGDSDALREDAADAMARAFTEGDATDRLTDFNA